MIPEVPKPDVPEPDGEPEHPIYVFLAQIAREQALARAVVKFEYSVLIKRLKEKNDLNNRL